MSTDSVWTSCIADWTDCRMSRMLLFAQKVASGGRESRIDGLAVGHLTRAAASAGHPLRRMCEFKFAAHVRTARSTQIGDDPAGVVRDEARPGIPVVKAAKAPARAPAGPQRPEVIDPGVLGDLEELSAVCLAISHGRAHCSRDRIRALPAEGYRISARGGRAEPGAHGCAACCECEQQR